MDVTFSCPKCRQQLEADAALAGTAIECPSCGGEIIIPPTADAPTHHPAAPPQEAHHASAEHPEINAMASSAAAKQEYHFAVPVHDAPTEILIQKPNKPLEVAAREGDKQIRIRTIKRTDCVEVGHDRFDEIVSEFLQKIGDTNIVAINPINYTHLDIGSQKLMTEFGVMIVYKG